MSKNPPSNFKNAAIDKVVIRDVFPLGLKGQNELMIKPPSDLLAIHKDTGNEKNQSLLNRSSHLVVAFAAFVLLSFSIFMGSRVSNSRDMASSPAMKVQVGDRTPASVAK